MPKQEASPILVWFRRDLRLKDHPAMHAALARQKPVIPVYIFENNRGENLPGGASQWWLSCSLKSLDQSLRSLGSCLIVRQGDPSRVLAELVRDTGAREIFWNRVPEPLDLKLDEALSEELRKKGVQPGIFSSNLMFEPGSVTRDHNQPYQVFTAFWNKTQTVPDSAQALPLPRKMESPVQWPASLSIRDLPLAQDEPWTRGLADAWTPGEPGAHARLKAFLRSAVADYPANRDIPSVPGVSRLSPHLHFGEISVREVWRAVKETAARQRSRGFASGCEAYLRQLVWREFAHQLLYHFPHTVSRPLRKEFETFPWEYEARKMKAWTRGKTGYPIVDAGMRELWTTGWMHNRVRMIAASFLVKDLLIPWQKGAAWFWDTLVDADLANNTMGWQWVSGCGADAAPYFRIFNPVLQGEKFDPEGAYVRQWVPELKDMPKRWIHQPWNAPADILQKAGVALGGNYPHPVVDRELSRRRALSAYETLKNQKRKSPANTSWRIKKKS